MGLLLLLHLTVSPQLLLLLHIVSHHHPHPTLNLLHSATASLHHHRCHRTPMVPQLPQPKIHTPHPLKTPMAPQKPLSNLPQPSTISRNPLNRLMESKVRLRVLICAWIFMRLFIYEKLNYFNTSRSELYFFSTQ